MKKTNYIKLALFASALVVSSCTSELNREQELTTTIGNIDYSSKDGALGALIGAYSSFQDMGWEQIPCLAVRGDDVNSGGGSGTTYDQSPFHDTDMFTYAADYWMYDSLWSSWFQKILQITTQIEQLEKYRAGGVNSTLINQYIAECKTLRAFLTLQLSRTWGGVFIVDSTDQSKITVQSKDSVMKWIISQMGEAVPNLPAMRPNQRTDLKGGVTSYTALAIKAMAELEIKDYTAAAADTGTIMSSGIFSLYQNYYDLFKLSGKLADENLLEIQYSNFGTDAWNDDITHLFAFYGPTDWTPAVSGASGGWGFWEPSMKYIKFMLSRNETKRLQTSVIFTPAGIADLKSDPAYSTLPGWVSNKTQEGDQFANSPRYKFLSGKMYMPSTQITTSNTDYGAGKNYIAIRYAEILLMYAEAVSRGGTATAGSAVNAVNIVRQRANMSPLASVTSDQVMDEKYAELGTEWGIRFFDMVRLGNTAALSYDGRTFSMDKKYLPYPTSELDKSYILNQYYQANPNH